MKRAELPILLVENSSVVRRAMADWLRLGGYTVVTAIDGADALAELQAGLMPCLILLDLQSPQSVEFRRVQMQDRRIAHIPLVVYSGLYDPQIAADQLQATAYFYAPFDMKALLKVIDTHCRRSLDARSKAA